MAYAAEVRAAGRLDVLTRTGYFDWAVVLLSSLFAMAGHLIEHSRYGLISVAGGKLTTHRLIAIDALRRLRDPRLADLEPDCSRLPGTGWDHRTTALLDLQTDVARHLERLYGDEAGAVLDIATTVPNGLERINLAGPDIWAQAAYAVAREWACTAEDIARRRTTLSVRGQLTPAIEHRLSALVGRVPVLA